MGGSSGPLADLLVVDLSRALAGPHATMMMGDLGARIIKVEVPGGGDDTRGWGPPFRWPSDDGHAGERAESADDDAERESTYFLSANRNKESVVLDLKADDDREVLLELVDRADVLVENFRTGVLERLGVGIADLQARNPRLVILSITGFGHDGPEGGRAGYDQIAQGEAGLMSITGSAPDDPQKVGTPISDILAGMYGAFGVMAALHEREQTGRGQVIRTSLLAATVGVHGFQGTRWTVAGEVGRAAGNHHPSVSPYGLFRCADGAVQIAVGSEGLWHDFCEGFDLDPDMAGMATNPERVAVQRGRHRGRGTGVRRLDGRGPARAAGRDRHPGRQGALLQRGLRLGPDRQPGPDHRCRARQSRYIVPAGTSAQVLRCRGARDDRHAPHGTARPRRAR